MRPANSSFEAAIHLKFTPRSSNVQAATPEARYANEITVSCWKPGSAALIRSRKLWSGSVSKFAGSSFFLAEKERTELRSDDARYPSQTSNARKAESGLRVYSSTSVRYA